MASGENGVPVGAHTHFDGCLSIRCALAKVFMALHAVMPVIECKNKTAQGEIKKENSVFLFVSIIFFPISSFRLVRCKDKEPHNTKYVVLSHANRRNAKHQRTEREETKNGRLGVSRHKTCGIVDGKPTIFDFRLS